jgi:hypothetical protein
MTDLFGNPLPAESAPPADHPTAAHPARPTGRNRPRPQIFPDFVEAEIKRRGLPYVNVKKAKEKMRTTSRLTAFHFVVYNQTGGPNWLVLARRRPSLADVADMREWEKVFGDGFMGVMAIPKPLGPRFTELDCTPLDLDDLKEARDA